MERTIVQSNFNKRREIKSHLLSEYIKGALVMSKFQFDVESFDLKFQRLSDETSKFKFGNFSTFKEELRT